MIPALLWITPPRGPLEFIRRALAESDDDLARVAVLYRRPKESIRARLQSARALRELCADHGVRFLTQDLELALCVGADGVHLPENGVPVSALRSRVGLLGASRHSRVGLERAFEAGADYCTLSPVFASPDKGTPLGLEVFRSLCAGLGPVLALGGVLDATSAQAAQKHGAAGIATIRGVASSADFGVLLAVFAPSS